MKNFLKQIEEKERKNREEKEREKKKKEELNKNKEKNRKIRLEKEKENDLKEEKLRKENEINKKKLEQEEKIKKEKEKEEKFEKIEADNRRRNTMLINFRKENFIDIANWTNEDFKKKKTFWNDLSIKEREYLKQRNELKKIILKNQYESRNKISNKILNFEVSKVEDVKKKIETIKDMCILGDIMKKEIIEEKKEKPEKFIPIEEAVKKEDKSTFILGLLAQKLENCGITTAIENDKVEEEEKENEKEIDESGTSLQFLINGLATKKKYNLHFDINEKRNEELLNDKEEQDKFINNLRKKLAKKYNISEEEIIITNPQRGSFQLSVIFLFQSEDFDLELEDVKETFKDEPELVKLKEIQKELLFNGCTLKKSMLDARGNNADGGWGKGEKRGGEEYIPPEGWIGYGLKVLDKYDLEKEGKQNDWLAYDNREGEWCVAYHGVGSEYSSKEVAKAVNGIANFTLKEKKNLNNNINEEEDDEEDYDYAEDDDIRHPGNKVGRGVYCSPNPDVMDNYAGKVEINNEIYKMGFMLRVNPEKIRVPVGNLNFWVLNGNPDEVRPYRILIKKVEE